MKPRSGTFRFSFTLAAICGVALLLGGCGQRGPLYLPQQGKPASAPVRTVGPEATSPASDNGDVLTPSTSPAYQ